MCSMPQGGDIHTTTIPSIVPHTLSPTGHLGEHHYQTTLDGSRRSPHKHQASHTRAGTRSRPQSHYNQLGFSAELICVKPQSSSPSHSYFLGRRQGLLSQAFIASAAQRQMHSGLDLTAQACHQGIRNAPRNRVQGTKTSKLTQQT